MQCLGREWVIILGFPPVVYPSSNCMAMGVVICAVPTADAVAIGEGKKRKTRRRAWTARYGRGDRGSREMRLT